MVWRVSTDSCNAELWLGCVIFRRLINNIEQGNVKQISGRKCTVVLSILSWKKLPKLIYSQIGVRWELVVGFQQIVETIEMLCRSGQERFFLPCHTSWNTTEIWHPTFHSIIFQCHCGDCYNFIRTHILSLQSCCRNFIDNLLRKFPAPSRKTKPNRYVARSCEHLKVYPNNTEILTSYPRANKLHFHSKEQSINLV
jgi:hypothetical protein